LFDTGTPNTDVVSWDAKNQKVQTKHVEKLMKYFTAQAEAAKP
jgi:hypothetical protein